MNVYKKVVYKCNKHKRKTLLLYMKYLRQILVTLLEANKGHCELGDAYKAL